jgi:hypothetical protein
MKQFLTLAIAAFCLTGCQVMEKKIESKKFSDYIQTLKKRGWTCDIEISILHDDSVKNEYDGLFESVSFEVCDANKIRELIIKHSYHPEKFESGESIDWLSHAVIKIYSEDPVYICIDPTGFAFDTNQGLTGFSNPELANYLVDMFKKAGLPKISKLFKDNKYLYESYIEMRGKRGQALTLTKEKTSGTRQ